MKTLLSNNFCNNCLILFISLFIIFLNLDSSSKVKPFDSVDELHKSLEKISNKKINSESFTLMLHTVKKTYDSEKMSKMILGNFWRKIDVKEKNKFIKVFEEYIVIKYLRQFSKIKQFTFEHSKIEEIGKKYRLASVLLKVGEDKPIKISYLLNLKDKQWKIFDVLIEGSISEIATKKSEFSQILNNEGISGLMSEITEKNKF